ncbi:DUF551 domain-containing protein [Enterobacter hormaechei]|nr:DUF551 domain-containing protein [Enterobacter hormaechei subsp. steigerwaltii]
MSNIDKHAVQAVADLKAGYTLGHADVAILNELARIALASLEAEAVALRDERSGSGGISKKPGFNDLPHGTPLYAAPPAPVALPVQHWEELCRQNPDMSIGDAIIRAAWWNHCAAMLQGAERVTTDNKLPAIGWLRADYQDDNRGLRGNAPLFVLGKKDPSTVWGLDYIPLTSNSPVIPDGWVACSERMPEVGVKVLCFPVNDEPIHATYNGQVWLQDISWSVSDEPIDNVISCNVTHWMPLPAAPQQE